MPFCKSLINSNNFFKLVWRNLGEIVIKYVCSDVPLTEGLAKKRSQAAFSLYCHKLCLSRKAVFDSTQFSSLFPAIMSTQSFFHQFTSFTKKPEKNYLWQEKKFKVVISRKKSLTLANLTFLNNVLKTWVIFTKNLSSSRIHDVILCNDLEDQKF